MPEDCVVLDKLLPLVRHRMQESTDGSGALIDPGQGICRKDVQWVRLSWNCNNSDTELHCTHKTLKWTYRLAEAGLALSHQ